MEQCLTSWSADSWSLFSNPSQTAQSIFFYMQETGCFHTFYPYYTERENLNSFLILHTLSGRGILCCQGQEYELARGQAFLSTAWITINILRPKAPTGTFYGCLLTESSPWLFYGIYQKTASASWKTGRSAPSRIESCIRQIMELYSKKDITTEVLSAS